MFFILNVYLISVFLMHVIPPYPKRTADLSVITLCPERTVDVEVITPVDLSVIRLYRERTADHS